VVKVGQQVEVYVLELDHKRQRIALSLRRVQNDPWEAVEDNYAPGQIVTGTVSNVVDFGAFVVLDDGVEGLLHVSEMADGTLSDPYSYLKRGDKVTAKVARIEAGRKRIGFTQQGLDLKGPADVPESLEQAGDESVQLPADQEAVDDDTPPPPGESTPESDSDQLPPDEPQATHDQDNTDAI